MNKALTKLLSAFMLFFMSILCGCSEEEIFFKVTLPEVHEAFSVQEMYGNQILKGKEYEIYVYNMHLGDYDYDTFRVFANEKEISAELNTEVNDYRSEIYIIKNVNEDISISFKIEKHYKSITINASDVYEVRAINDITDTIEIGQNYIFELVFEEKYHIPKVLCNGAEINSKEGIYTIANVRNDLIIDIDDPVIRTYRISYQSYRGYALTDLGLNLTGDALRLEHGDEFRFQVTVDLENYYVTDLKVYANDIEVVVDLNGYYLLEVKTNIEITVKGVIQIPRHTIMFDLGTSGRRYVLEKLNFTSNSMIKEGTVIQFRIYPIDGYTLDEIDVYLAVWNNEILDLDYVRHIYPDEDGVFTLEVDAPYYIIAPLEPTKV